MSVKGPKRINDLPTEINEWLECEDCQTWWLEDHGEAAEHVVHNKHGRILQVKVAFVNNKPDSGNK